MVRTTPKQSFACSNGANDVSSDKNAPGGIIVPTAKDSTSVPDNTIYLICNNVIMRAGIRYQLQSAGNFNIIGEGNYQEDFRDKIYKLKPNIVILSKNHCDSTSFCLDAIKNITQDNPLIKPVVLTDETDEKEFCRYAQAGARGYLDVAIEANEMVKIINGILQGECRCDDSLQNFVFRVIKTMADISYLPFDKPIDEQFNLSKREYEILEAASGSFSYGEIAQTLKISRHTVKMHLSNIYKKLGVKRKHEAILKVQNKICQFRVKKGVWGE